VRGTWTHNVSDCVTLSVAITTTLHREQMNICVATMRRDYVTVLHALLAVLDAATAAACQRVSLCRLITSSLS